MIPDCFVDAARRRRRISLWIECCFWIVGILGLAFAGVFWGRALVEQAMGNRELDSQLRADRPVASASAIPEGSLAGRIIIPRLDLASVIFTGTSEATLAKGVGLLHGSASPGGPGNTVLAGHRDTFFEPLQEIRQGDVIVLVTARGEFRYVVEWTAIVDPDQTEVTQPTTRAALTLITCYPFGYFGNAPQRFIVRARGPESQVAANRH